MQKTGLKRNVVDKFYTKPTIARKCCIHALKYLKIKKTDIVIEPSAGSGSFISYCKKLSDNTIFIDLYPEYIGTDHNILKQDFLKYDTKTVLEKNINGSRIHIIGNPPFGRQSSMAIKFIKKCSTFCDTISFILPKSFKKTEYAETFSSMFSFID